MNTGKSKQVVLVIALAFLFVGAVCLAGPAGEWSGTVAVVSGDDLALVGVADHFRLAGSVTEMLSGRTLSPGDLATGSSVTLRVGPREADGRVRADRIVVEPKNPLVLTGELGRVADDRLRLQIHGVEIEIDDHTAFSGRGPAGTVRSARDLAAGMTVQATLVATAGGTLRATEVRTRPEPVSEPGEDLEARATVTAVSSAAWTIDAKAFSLTDQTVFLGDPGLGDFVEVRFHVDSNGSPVADRIQKEDDPPGIEVEFRGIVEAIGDSAWTISGRVVSIDASTQIVGSPSVGDSVEVEAHKSGDTLVARSIRLEDAREREVEFAGEVQGIGDAAWKIGGREVGVTPETEIRGNPGVGDPVEVRALQASDGSLTATRIRREDSAGNDDGGGDGQGGIANGNGNDDPAGDDHGGRGSGSSGHGHDD